MDVGGWHKRRWEVLGVGGNCFGARAGGCITRMGARTYNVEWQHTIATMLLPRGLFLAPLGGCEVEVV